MKIAVANVKGGVGKSTVANVVAQYLRLPLKNTDVFQDPYIFNKVEKYRSGDDYVVDTGGYIGKELEREIRDADAVIVPLQPAPRDLFATIDFLEWLLSFYTGKVLVLANRSTEKKAEELKEAIAEAINNFKRIEAEDVRFSRLPELQSLQSWEMDGASWLDYLKVWNRSQRKAAEYVREFCDELKAWIINSNSK